MSFDEAVHHLASLRKFELGDLDVLSDRQLPKQARGLKVARNAEPDDPRGPGGGDIQVAKKHGTPGGMQHPADHIHQRGFS